MAGKSVTHLFQTFSTVDHKIAILFRKKFVAIGLMQKPEFYIRKLLGGCQWQYQCNETPYMFTGLQSNLIITRSSRPLKHNLQHNLDYNLGLARSADLFCCVHFRYS